MIPRTTRVFLEPIAIVRNAVTDREGLQSFKTLESQIVFKKKYARGLRGIEDYSHLSIIFWLNKAVKDRTKVELITRPGHREYLPKVGVFATRNAVHRPNHLGMTVVELLGRNSNILRVRGLDAFDGSPVLDIKPYFRRDTAGTRRMARRSKGKRLSMLDFEGRIIVPEWWSRWSRG